MTALDDPSALTAPECFANQALPGPATGELIETRAKAGGLSREAATATVLEDGLHNSQLFRLPKSGRYAAVTAHWLPGGYIGDSPGRSGHRFGPRRQARLFILVDKPGYQDMSAGRYLGGDAGQLLARVGGECDADLNGAYATGAIKFADPYPRMPSIPAAWAEECRWFLEEELVRVRPEIVLVCGAKPLKFLLSRNAKLGSYRSALIPYRGLRLLATADLGGLVKNPETLPGLEADMRLLARSLSGAGTTDSPPAYHYLLDADSLRPVLDYCRDFSYVAVDCEWEGESPRTGGRLLTIQFSVLAREAFVVVLRSKTSGREFSPNPETAVEMLRELFLRPDLRIIGQNFRADLEWLIPLGLDLTSAYAEWGFDAMLASHLLAEGDAHDLTSLTLRYSDMGRYDVEARRLLDRGLTHADLPDEVLWPYAAADVDALMRIYPVLHEALWRDHLRVIADQSVDWRNTLLGPDAAPDFGLRYFPSLWTLFRHVVMAATLPLKEIELEGLPVDQDRLRTLTQAFSRRRDRLDAELRELAGDPEFNPDSPAQVKEILFGDPQAEGLATGTRSGSRRLQLGLTPVKSSGKPGRSWAQLRRDGEVAWEPGKGWLGNPVSPSTDAETLALLAADSGGEFVGRLRDYRTVNTMARNLLTEPVPDESGTPTHEKGLAAHIDPDGRVRTTISQLAETGRYRSFDPALMNLPKSKESVYARIFGEEKLPPIRSILQAPAGGVYLEADIKSAELFTLAHLADDPGFKAALAARDGAGNPLSFHTVAMCKFFKLPMPPEEATAIMESGGVEGKRLKGLRTAAKSVIFGIPYGRGAQAICQAVRREGVACTPEDAKTWIGSYRESFPRAWDYLEWCQRQVRDPGFIINPYGRTRHFAPTD
ncbi:MAG: hypothetical protein LBU64_07370, partial [Planctomycetota bacterium]|nr:hypothetical protein [Planctomycetota bacterium]